MVENRGETSIYGRVSKISYDLFAGVELSLNNTAFCISSNLRTCMSRVLDFMGFSRVNFVSQRRKIYCLYVIIKFMFYQKGCNSTYTHRDLEKPSWLQEMTELVGEFAQ